MYIYAMQSTICPICKELLTRASRNSAIADKARIVCENEYYIHYLYKNFHFLVRTKLNIVAELEDNGLFQFVC